jgi:hypothetical protein
MAMTAAMAMPATFWLASCAMVPAKDRPAYCPHESGWLGVPGAAAQLVLTRKLGLEDHRDGGYGDA